MNLSTRALYPRNYEDLKQRMIAEYSQISIRKPHLVFKVIRGEDGKRHGEASFKFQMINTHKDLVILRGRPRTKYANREYDFTRDSEDQLLHCKLKSTGEMAMVARVAKFYRPEELPNEEEFTTPNALEPVKAMEIRRLH